MRQGLRPEIDAAQGNSRGNGNLKAVTTSATKNLALIFAALLILSLAVFYMSRLSPGDPLRAYYGEGAERMSSAERERATAALGLDAPIHVQYFRWLGDALHGDFGMSLKYRRPVAEVIGEVWGNTLALGLSAYILTFALALALGLFCALREDTPIDRAICKLGTAIGSIPQFWVALMLMLVFSVWLGWLPSGGAYSSGGGRDVLDRLRHLIMPLAVMVLGHLWYYAYMVRNRLLEETRRDYVLFCRARGMSRKRVLCRHCLRGIMPPFLGLMAASVPHIVGGTYVAESVFSYPGLGTLCFESAKYHDYNLLSALTLITGLLVIVSGFLARTLENWLAPGSRRERRGTA